MITTRRVARFSALFGGRFRASMLWLAGRCLVAWVLEVVEGCRWLRLSVPGSG
jgi:hypothetical protein